MSHVYLLLIFNIYIQRLSTGQSHHITLYIANIQSLS